MKRAIIVHCWDGTSHYAWYQSAKLGLEEKDYSVTVLDMPDTENPKLHEWLQHLTQAIDQPDDELVLIGHSLGNVTIMRYLETLATNQYIDKAIMVAAFTDQLGFRELENFFETPLDFQYIKSRSKRGFTVIQSDNDPYVAVQYGTRLQEELGAKLIIKHGLDHMSGAANGEQSCTELPDVAENV